MSTDSASAHQTLFAKAAPLEGAIAVAGPRFDLLPAAGGNACQMAISAMGTIGFQGTHFGRAVGSIRQMIADRAEGNVIYLGVVANLFASGVRDALIPLASKRLVDHVVISGGGVEHDLRRLFPFHDYRVGCASQVTRRLHMGDISYIPGPCPAAASSDDALCCFDHVIERLIRQLITTRTGGKQIDDDHCPKGMKARGPAYAGRFVIAPSEFWRRICLTLHSLDSTFAAASFAVQCALNSVNIYSPSFIDGDIAEQVLKFDELAIDLVDDLNKLNRSALKAAKTGVIIVGGGVVKHHLCNANIMRNGTDSAVFINTAQEYDGSDGGARPDEAVSWGKIKLNGQYVKIYAEATVTLPLLIHQAVAGLCVDS